ncbi:MAG: hypothetical protein HYY65_07460 [Candidatus Tectomicrobia bacterium]|uniref:Uncharacterized protein n=1 Tax=Tectimicrobiota bacterium TaxID=2528274 RepID=A0A932GPP8_UNCTE|nr:hypothetical protein [Candidatus Tectomicrobia bacterium]
MKTVRHNGEKLSPKYTIQGSFFVLKVYQRPGRKGDVVHVVETTFQTGDRIISDGMTAEEAIGRMYSALPLAIESRELGERIR